MTHTNNAEQILAKAFQRFQSRHSAEAWYHATALPGFSGKTAEELVDCGRYSDVLDYIDATDAGVFC
jgi:hypothetical protein